MVMLTLFIGSFHTLRAIYVVIGETGVGKSSLINQIAGYNVTEEGTEFASMTSETKKLFIDDRGTKEFRNSIFVDTPGFSDTRGYAINTTGLLIEMMENINRTANFKFLLCASAKDTRQYVQRIMDKLLKTFGTEIIKSTIIVLTFPRYKKTNLTAVWELLKEQTNHELQIVKYDSKIPYDNQDAKLLTALEKLTPYNWVMLEEAIIRLDLMTKELYEHNSNWIMKNITALETVYEKETCYRTKEEYGSYGNRIFKSKQCTYDHKTTCYQRKEEEICNQKAVLLRDCLVWLTRISQLPYDCYKPLTVDCSTTEAVNQYITVIEPYDCHMPRVKEVIKYEKYYINSDDNYWRKEAKKQLISVIKKEFIDYSKTNHTPLTKFDM